MPLFQEDSWSHDAFRPITRDEKYLMNHNQNYSLSKTVNLRGKNEFTIINSHFIFPFLILHSLFHISYSISSILHLPFAFSNISFASHLRTSPKRQLDPFVPNVTQYPQVLCWQIRCIFETNLEWITVLPVSEDRQKESRYSAGWFKLIIFVFMSFL